MDTRLSEKWAKVNITAIGIFYLFSGIWEILNAGQGAETGRNYFLLDAYCNYSLWLGLITLLVGIGLLLRINFVRLIALILAWWNLFSSPLIHIWWNMYAILIKKFLVTDSWTSLYVELFILIAIYTSIRIYIIYMLRISKAGYIFLKKKKMQGQ